jgi:hypothetical protein
MESWARIRDFSDLFADIGGVPAAAQVAEAPDPAAEAAPEPVVEAAPEPEPEPKPVVEAVPEPEPVVETVPEPEPIVEAVPEPVPVVETVPEPEPIVEAVPEPVPVETVPEPEPIVEAVPEPVPVVETVPAPEPVVETVPEPVPVVEAVPEPVPVVEAVPEPVPVVEAVPEPVPLVEATTPEPVTDQEWAEDTAVATATVVEEELGLAAEAAAVPTPEPTPEPMPGLAEQTITNEQDEQLDAIFGELIEESWEYLKEHELASQIDEVFLGAVISGAVDGGYSLIDLTSDGTHHYLRFENLNNTSRLVFRLKHLTGDVVTAKVVGQRASVVIGYGEKATNIGQIMNALKAEFKSGFIINPEPGTITVDGDLTSGYVYCQVDMFWKIDDYITGEYIVSTEKLMLHITACRHALRKYLRGRFS